MSWWDIVKMSDAIKWVIEHLEDNTIIEVSGYQCGDNVDIILEVPINPAFIEWAKGKYQIDFLKDISNLPSRKKYRITAIGE